MPNKQKTTFDTEKNNIDIILRTLRVENKISQNTFDELNSRLKLMHSLYPSIGDFATEIKRITCSTAIDITIGTPKMAKKYVQYTILNGADKIVITEQI